MAAAASRVECITELLERILYAVNPSDILICTRISQRWRRIVYGSKELRQVVFLQSATHRSLSHIVYGLDLGVSGYGDADFAQEPQKIYINPMLLPLLKAMLTVDAWRSQTENVPTMENFYVSALQCMPASWRAADASWKRLLVTQPACDNARILAQFYTYNENPSRTFYGAVSVPMADKPVETGITGRHLELALESLAVKMNQERGRILALNKDRAFTHQNYESVTENEQQAVKYWRENFWVELHCDLTDKALVFRHHEELESLPALLFDGTPYGTLPFVKSEVSKL